jgi:hypothetical protein
MVIVAVPGAVLLARRRRGGVSFAPLVAVVGAVVVTAAVSYGNHRFRLAADPVVAICAAMAVVSVVGSFRNRPA